jgi:hypothetical protein
LVGEVVGIAASREDAVNVDPTGNVGRVGASRKKRESSRKGDDDDRQRVKDNSSAFSGRVQTRAS